jgi:hypothetical protein
MPFGSLQKPPGAQDHPEWDWSRDRPRGGINEPGPLPPGQHADFDWNRAKPEDHPEWDWSRDRPRGGVDEPGPIPKGDHADFDLNRQKPDDHPEWDWTRDRPRGGVDEPGPVPPGDHADFDWNRENPEDHPEWDWDRNVPLQPVVNPDVENQATPWASSPDDESDDGRAPRPMSVPEDLYSEPSEDDEKEEPKGTVLPVWLSLTLVVLASLAGGSTVANAPPVTGSPPNLLFDPITPTTNAPPVLPKLPVTPTVPCPQDAACGHVMSALDPAMPPQTRALINVPGTCQNWAREWLRTGKDIMEFQVERIRQRFAMALMYCEFNGDNWLQGDLWVSDLHECDWYTMIGVDPCGRFEQYQIIRNYGQQMRGTLPPELSMMTSLWEVTLSDNLISGTIPKEFAQLEELDTLGLSYNLLTGSIPDFVWKYEDMVYMDLAYNFFDGTIPNGVYMTSPNLRDLFLENNNLEGAIPTDFGMLDWKRLHLDNNQFKGPIPSDINAGRMEELMLHNNQLTGKFPSADFATNFAGKQSSLKTVTLHNNNIQDDVNQMCDLFFTGQLATFEVDLDKVKCDCCTQGGL